MLGTKSLLKSGLSHALKRGGTCEKSSMAKRDEWAGVAEVVDGMSTGHALRTFERAGQMLAGARSGGRREAAVPRVSNTG